MGGEELAGRHALLGENLTKLGKPSADLTPIKPRHRDEPWRWQLATRLPGKGVSQGGIAEHLGYSSAASPRVRLHRANWVRK